MQKSVKSTSGFTFVETIISFSIVGIFLSLTWATVSFLLTKTNDQIVRTRGHFLAVEGVEAVKQIRQTMVNQNRLSGFYNSIGSKNGNYILNKESNYFLLEPGDNELIEMNEEPFTTYCRTIELDGEGLDSRKITVTVKWGDVIDCSKSSEMIAYSTYLTDMSQ